MMTEKDLLERATEFKYDPEAPHGYPTSYISIQKRSNGWAVCDFRNIYTREERWDWEPSPSNRDEEWLKTAYWPSIQAAFEAADRAMRMVETYGKRS